MHLLSLVGIRGECGLELANPIRRMRRFDNRSSSREITAEKGEAIRGRHCKKQFYQRGDAGILGRKPVNPCGGSLRGDRIGAILEDPTQ